MTNYLYFPSIKAFAKQVIDFYRRGDFSALKECREYLENINNVKGICGDSKDFHDAVKHFESSDFFDYAYGVAEIGHNYYPDDPVLLGDLLECGMRCRVSDSELSGWNELLTAQKDRWKWPWTVFFISFNYQLERQNESEATLDLIRSFKEMSSRPDIEKAYIMEYKYWLYIHDGRRAIAALEEAINLFPYNCCQCSLIYAEYLYTCRRYGEAAENIRRAISIAGVSPTIDMGRAYYLLAISLEAQARERRALTDNSLIEKIYTAYAGACFYFRLNREGIVKIRDELKPRIEFLEIETKIESNIFKNLDLNFSDQVLCTPQYVGGKGLFPSYYDTIDDHRFLTPN